MPTKLCKWGNSLGVRLPQYVVERTGLHSGDYLFIRLSDAGDIIVRPVKRRELHSAYAPQREMTERKCPTAPQVAEEW
jgi:antitoxin MazE